MMGQKQRFVLLFAVALSLTLTAALALVLATCQNPDKAPDPPTNAPQPMTELEGTEWLLSSLYGNEPVEGASVTLGFFPENYLEGGAGCNSYGADYVLNGTTFELLEIHRTSFDCSVPDGIMEQEKAHFEALSSIATYRATAERLAFSDATGEEILVFVRKLPPAVDPALADTEWTLAFLHDEEPLQGSRITLNLRQEGFDGFTGCNRYGGEYEAANEGVLSIESVSQTAMECESDALTDQEQAYVEALRNAASYRVIDDRLEIENSVGETTLVFVKQNMLAMNPDDLPGTAWRLASLDGTNLIEGSTITLAFHNDYRASGHGGCRDYLANYQASSKQLSFLFLAMMEAACSGEKALLEQEGEFTTLLGWASGYQLRDGQLEILTERGEVLVFEPLPAAADSSLEGATWVLSAFIERTDVEGWTAPMPYPTEPLPDTRITVTFEDGITSGSAGCNSYGASFATDGPAIQVETPEATETDCQDPPGIMAQEQRYLDVLKDVVAYYIHYDQLWLETDDGRALVFAVEAKSYGAADLVSDLRAAGLAVEATQEMVDHGFAISGQRVLINSTPIFVYEFTDEVMADDALAGVSVDEYSMTVTRIENGIVYETHGDWVETPHLYRRGRLVVIVGDDLATLEALEPLLGAPMSSTAQKDCSLPNAFPAEEAQLIWPTLHQVQPDPAAPGDEVEVRGTGGFLYWNNECGEFQNESARDFQLLFDGEPVDTITCYAHTCLVNLTIPADASPGIHTISVEGGSSIDIQIGDKPLQPQSNEVQDLELVGYLGSSQARAVAVQGSYAYVGIDIELVVVDVSDPNAPQRVGRLFLPGLVMDIALIRDVVQDRTYAYVVVGNGTGLYVVETTDPTKPVLDENYYSGSYVSEIMVAGGYAYVSGNMLHTLDVTNPAAPIEVDTQFPDPSTPWERLVAVVAGDAQGRTYAYTGYEYLGNYGFGIVDLTEPVVPVALGSLTVSGSIREVVIVGEYAFLLVGPGIGRLVIVDISDPQNPVEVHSALASSWGIETLAVQGHHLYLAGDGRNDDEPNSAIQILNVADPTNPVVLGHCEGISPSVLDIVVEDERAYVAAGDGLSVLDVSDPNAPTCMGAYHAHALTGTGRDLVVSGSTVYVAAGESGLQVVDVSDPINPRVVGSHDTSGHTWAIALTHDDPQGHIYAYLADEYNGLRVLDVSDSLAPVEVGAYDLPRQEEFFHGVAVEGDYAYVADGGLIDTGLRVFNVSDPAHPFEVAFLPLMTDSESTPPPRVEGVAVAAGYVYLAAGTAGLRVIDVSDPVAPVQIGAYGTPGRADNLMIADSYAYIVDGDLRIVDVSDPAAPAEVGFYDLPDSGITPHVAVQGQHAYLTSDGLQIFDISSPGALLEAARHPIPRGRVAVTNDTVYVLGDGLFILRELPPAD